MDNVLIGNHQLFWLEELNPCYWVTVRAQCQGQPDVTYFPPLFEKALRIADLPVLVRRCPRLNLWRSWHVFLNANASNSIGIVPLILDIDDECEPPDLGKAYKLTRLCLGLLANNRRWAGADTRLRITFSGRKGFHIEVKPAKPLDATEMRRELLRACENHGFKREANQFFCGSTVIDVLNPRRHPWVRLTNTLYSWRSDGVLQVRRVFQMTPVQFRQSTPETILAQAMAYAS